MHALFVSKFFPLVGQVSTLNLWLARGLIQLGHSVSVCSDTGWVDSRYRCEITAPPDLLLQEFMGRSEFAVRYCQEWTGEHFYIPPVEPRTSLLVSEALVAIEERRPDVIFAHYLEPYLIAGYVVSSLTGIPLIASHAGSDIARLALGTSAGAAYRAVLSAPNVRFVAKGVLARQLSSKNLAATPAEYVPDINFVGTPSLEPRRKRFRFGFYGKVADGKTLLAIASAVETLTLRGIDAELVVLGRPLPGFEERWNQCTRTMRCIRIDDYIPNWEIGSFVRSCDAILYLKDGYRTRGHSSIVPKEVIAAGGHLIASPESVASRWYQENVIPGRDYTLYSGATDAESLTMFLEAFIEERTRVGPVSPVAPAISDILKVSHHRFISSWESILFGGVNGSA